MNSLLSGLAAAVLSLPPVVAPSEPMVRVPGLEELGQSRISTVLYCAKQAGVDDYRELMTDSEFERMHDCLAEHT